MRLHILLIIMILSAVSVSAAEYSAAKNEWIFIPVSLPEPKIGGGDFYNLDIEVDEGNGSIEYSIKKDGIMVKSQEAGIYDISVLVNHISKSSCAGVDVNQHISERIELHVTE